MSNTWERQNTFGQRNFDLASLVYNQLRLEQKMHTEPNTLQTLDQKMQTVRNLCTAINVELAELLNELPWKTWKPVERQSFNERKALEEAADVFIFFLDLWLLLAYIAGDESPTQRLYEEVSRKQLKNLLRVDEGEFKS